MSLRNTIMGEKEQEQNTITFSLNGDEGTSVSYTCDAMSLGSFLLNLVDIGNRLMEDEQFPEQLVKAIHDKWKEDLSTK